MSDINVKCCRCRHLHKESERLEQRSKRFSWGYEMVCPKCGAKSYYDMTPQVAYCWASGEIAFASTHPDGSIPIATGPKSELSPFIKSMARHSRTSQETLLLPGVPEAPDMSTRLGAVKAFIDRIIQSKSRLKRFPGVRAWGEA